MKTLLSSLFLGCVFILSAQTSVISLKSHHGKMSDLAQSEDAFGVVAPPTRLDSVIKISTHCVIQSGKVGHNAVPFRDTVCNHWYYEKVNYEERKIKEYHNNGVVLVGFDDTQSNVQIENSPFFKKRSKKQSLHWFFILLTVTGLGVFIAQPKIGWKK